MAVFQVHQFPCRSDNYGVLLHDHRSNVTASIDAPLEEPILAALDETGWALTHILTTHHHEDHTSANLALKDKFNCTIVGPRDEASKIPGIDIEVGDGDTYDFGGNIAQIIGTPGHTLGHICFYFADDAIAFVGDTLFPLGCGRVFEGTMEQMHTSLQKLAALPPGTRIYCGHEYTYSNAKFAITVEPKNAALRTRYADVEAMHGRGIPTVPTTMELELETNPFLRVSSAEQFAEVRQAKDNF